MENEKKMIVFSSRDELLRIDVQKIVYFEADGNYTNIVTQNKIRSSVCMNLGQMEQVLASQCQDAEARFVRIGKKYIINIDYIYKISSLKKQLVLTNYENFVFQLELSKDALKKLKEMMIKINTK